MTRLYTLEQVAAALQVSKRKAYYLREQGLIQAIRIGEQWRVREEELERLTREGTNRPRPVAVRPHTLSTGRRSSRR